MDNNEKKIMRIAKSAVGKKIGFYDFEHKLRNFKNKGSIGNVIQSGLFGLSENNSSLADFLEAGVELKVTPYRILKGTDDKHFKISAKERLTLHNINYTSDLEVPLSQSTLWGKCKKMLIVFYEYDPKKTIEEFIIGEVLLMDLEKENKNILENDWGIIQKYIGEGKAHELSEGLTTFLGACTKGNNSKFEVKQPRSSIKAKKRAYCLKQKYMTSIVRRVINREKVYSNKSRLLGEAFDMDRGLMDNILDKFQNYYGKSKNELIALLNIPASQKNKAIFKHISTKILGLDSSDGNIDLEKAGIAMKAIRLENDMSINESMSFPAFSFIGITEEKWEDSYLRNLFDNTKFLFIVYKNNGEDYVLEKCFFWEMSKKDLDVDLRGVYEKTQKIIRENVILTEGNVVRNNLPKMTESRIAHVRPHAAKASYKPLDPNADELPDGRWMTKQCFFLNKSYIENIVVRNINS